MLAKASQDICYRDLEPGLGGLGQPSRETSAQFVPIPGPIRRDQGIFVSTLVGSTHLTHAWPCEVQGRDWLPQ